MDIGKMVREELTAVLGSDAENISSEVYDQVAAGAKAARVALGSDLLYENWLGRQAQRLQAAETEEAEAERAARSRFSKFFTYDDDKPAAPTSRFFER